MSSYQYKYKIPAVIFTLAAYICSFAGFVTADIICFGDDGHISIEATESSSLPPLTPVVTRHSDHSDHSDHSEENHCEDQCNSCIDVPLSYTTGTQNFSENKYVFKLERNPLCQQYAKPTGVSAVEPVPVSHITGHSIVAIPVTLLRTIVLLI